MAPPRWLADEMLGRLARYLRFVGCDTLYVRDVSDDEIVARAGAEGRVVLTRDRELARRAPGAFWVASPHLPDQWRAVRAAWPDVPAELSYERCPICNGTLGRYAPGTDPVREAGLPTERVRAGLEVWACSACGQLYWEGSHAAHIRARLAAWSGAAPA